MTAKSTRRMVDPATGSQRLAIARGFRRGAQDLHDGFRPGDTGNAVISLCVNAAIAYADALCVKFGGFISKDQHDVAPRALREAMKQRLPKSQETALKTILNEKSASQYSTRQFTQAEATAILVRLKAFGDWAEAEMMT